MGNVTATVSTKNRHGSTLPLTIQAILSQTVPPKQLVVFDDNDQFTDPNGNAALRHLLQLSMAKGVMWYWLPGQRKGQVANHETALRTTETDYVWRSDDDNIPEPDCLEKLLEAMGGNNVGAVGGLVLDPNHVGPKPSFVSGKIEDIYCPMNLQWFDWSGAAMEVDHLYSTFLYRVEAGKKAGGYSKELSVIGHREETMFTHSIKRAGYRLLVTPKAVTWHLREETGGIRSYKDPSFWERDEVVFLKKLAEWGVKPRTFKIIVLDCGIGDHIVARSVMPQIIAKHAGARIVLAVCYPEFFSDLEGVTLATIADAKAAFGNLDNFSVYAWCEAHGWKRPLAEAFLEMNT
jgi:hypothetical protein